MKLIIDIPENEYRHIKEYYEKNDIVEATYSYIYHGTPLEQEPKIDILKQIRAEINHTYEQEKEIDTKWAAGLKYSLKIIDKAMSEVSE